MVKTNQWLSGCLHEPLLPAKELVNLHVVEVCADLAHFEDASSENGNATGNMEYTYGFWRLLI